MKDIDNILKHALTPKDEPDFWLNQKILSQLKEVKQMKQTRKKQLATIMLAFVCALGISSVTIYAAWKYLMPDQVIEDLGEEKLTDAFLSEDAIFINETQSYGDYDVTLLGITSGKNLTNYKVTTDGVLREDRSYLILAVENSDEAFSSTFESAFSVFPVLKGYDPEIYYTLFLGGNVQREIVKDGILYLMTEYDNLEIFANHEIYLCVSDDMPDYTEYSYTYDKTTGTISRNEAYEGLNALFPLPLNPAKADPKAAEEYLKDFEARGQEAQNQPSEKTPASIEKARQFVENLTPENIDEYATPLTYDGAAQTIIPDAQGRISYCVKDESGNFSKRAKGALKDFFPNEKTSYISSDGFSGSTEEEIMRSLTIDYLTLNEDGSVTLQLYAPKPEMIGK